MKTWLPMNMSTAMVASPSRAGEPILHWYPMLRRLSRMLLRLNLSLMRRTVLARSRRYPIPMQPPTTMLMPVAMAAPFTPMSSGKMNSQSSMVLIIAVMTEHHMAYCGAPSRRIMKSDTDSHIWKGRAGTIHSR